MPLSDLRRIEVSSRAEWRAWLARHHGQRESIWLVTWKKGRGPHVRYADIVEEALCFGWIDSRPKKLDADRTMLLLSPRKAGSAWSTLNKQRISRLIEAGLVAPAGLAMVEHAKATGLWDKLDGAGALVEPAELKVALDALAVARRSWDGFPPSARRGILEWIAQAKRPETRARRIAETVRRAALGERVLS